MNNCFSSPLPVRASFEVLRISPSLSGYMCLTIKSSTIRIATGARRVLVTLCNLRNGIVYNLS